MNFIPSCNQLMVLSRHDTLEGGVMSNVFVDKRRGKPDVYACLQGGREESKNRDFLST